MTNNFLLANLLWAFVIVFDLLLSKGLIKNSNHELFFSNAAN